MLKLCQNIVHGARYISLVAWNDLRWVIASFEFVFFYLRNSRFGWFGGILKAIWSVVVGFVVRVKKTCSVMYSAGRCWVLDVSQLLMYRLDNGYVHSIEGVVRLKKRLLHVSPRIAALVATGCQTARVAPIVFPITLYLAQQAACYFTPSVAAEATVMSIFFYSKNFSLFLYPLSLI